MTQRIRRPVVKAPGSTTAGGWGADHQKRRKAAIAVMPEGAPCSRCGGPMYSWQKLHLDHDDIDRSQYRGLSHAACNIAASNRSPRRQISRARIAAASSSPRRWRSARDW